MKAQDVLPVIVSITVIITIRCVGKAKQALRRADRYDAGHYPAGFMDRVLFIRGGQNHCNGIQLELTFRPISHTGLCDYHLAVCPRRDEICPPLVDRLWRLGCRGMAGVPAQKLSRFEIAWKKHPNATA